MIITRNILHPFLVEHITEAGGLFLSFLLFLFRLLIPPQSELTTLVVGFLY